MLRKKALTRITLTTLVLFIMLVSFSFELITPNINKKLDEVEYVANLTTTHIYLLNEDNYLVKVDILLSQNEIIEQARDIINNLYVNNKKYNNLKGLIPSNTKINKIDFVNNTLIIDFSNDLLKVNKNLEEKVIESLVYSLLEIKEIKNIQLKIDGKIINKLEKSNITLPDILDESIGINKTFSINKIKDIQKVVLYYVFDNSEVEYFVPVTKYINSKEDKVKIIIDSLKGSFTSNTNLKSYLNYKTDIKDYSLDDDILTISFNSLNEENLECITYVLACSVFDSTEIEKVIFEVNDKIVAVRLNH